MKPKRIIALFSILLIASISRSNPIDSLQQLLEVSNKLDVRQGLIQQISWHYKDHNPEQALEWGYKALNLAYELKQPSALGESYKTLAVIEWYKSETDFCRMFLDSAAQYYTLANDSSGIADVYNNMGLSYHSEGRYGKARNYYQQALLIRLNQKDSVGMVAAYNNLGVIYHETGNHREALFNHTRAIQIMHTIDATANLADAYINIGNIYMSISDYRAAMKSYADALRYFERNDNPRGLADAHHNLGNALTELHKHDEARENYDTGLALYDSLGNISGQAATHRSLGKLFEHQKLYDKALSHYELSLAMSTQIVDQAGMIACYSHIGNVNLLLKRADIAISWLKRAASLAEKEKSNPLMKNVYDRLAQAYATVGNFEEAFSYQERFLSVIDTIYSQENAKAISQLRSLYELEQQEKAIELLKKEKELNQAEINVQRIRFAGLLTATLLLLFILIILYFVLQQKRQSHHLLQKQKEQIEDQNLTLAHTNDRLTTLNEEKNHLMGVVAHDLKNPLSQIKGLTSIIMQDSDQLSITQKKFLSMIEGSADRLTAMIHRILDVKAIESATLNLRMERVSLASLVEEVVSEYELRAKKKNIELLYEAPNHSTEVKVDKEYTRQVFDNLISNALKFSPHDKQISIQWCNGPKALKVCVKDQGPGIAKEDMSKLFGKYQKLAARPTAGESSSGLGLSIVKKYVEAMGGNVWCESKLGKGAEFWVGLPRTNQIVNMV